MLRKIILFTASGVGGAERVTVTIAKMLRNAGFDIKVAFFGEKDDGLSSFIPDDIKILHVGFDSPYRLSLIKLYLFIRRERPDIVFCASPAVNARLIIAAKLVGGIKVIVRNSNIFKKERKDVQLWMKCTYKYADKIILQQQEMLEEIIREIKLSPDKVVALQNPIDKETIDRLSQAPTPFASDGNINYVWTARFDRQKGQDILARAFVELHKTQVNSHLFFIGRFLPEDAFYLSVKSIIEKAGLLDYVHFIGYDANPYKWVKGCDCFVLPSRYEGLPNALIDAMYLNKPCVSTVCIPIIDRMIENGYNGYKVPNEDYMAMAEAMKKAVGLKGFSMMYSPSNEEMFINLFNDK